MNWLDKLERKYRKYAVPNLIQYVVVGMALVYVFYIMNRDIISMLTFSPMEIMQGQVWRVVTFLFMPLNFSPIWVLFSLLFAWFVGRSLESYWGTFKFNVYYFIGAIGTILGSILLYMITGVSLPTTNTYIHTSMFLALATIAPDYEIMLFLILPIKLKYLGYFAAGGLILNLVISLIYGNYPGALSLILSVANYLIFFGPGLLNKGNQKKRRQQYTQNRKPVGKKRVTKPKSKEKGEVIQVAFHCCEVCGRTEVDDPNLEFRYCSKCAGHHEYCTEHIMDHEHKTE